MRYINRLLLKAGWMLVPYAVGPKSLEEMANVCEVHHPSRGGRGVDWLRTVGRMELESGVPRHGRGTP